MKKVYSVPSRSPRLSQSASAPSAGRLLLALLLALLPLLGAAGSPPGGTLAIPAMSTGPALGKVLNPDGTLRADAKGSFDATGYRMHTGPNGRPAFSPAGIAGAGDENWQDGFGVPGANGTVNAVVRVGTSLYVGGNFTVVGNVAASRVAKWDGTAWSALGTGLNNNVQALATDASGNLYAGGTFTTAGGVAASRVAKWDGTAWSALGTGFNNTVQALAVNNGSVYAGGLFTTAGSTAASRVARWDGTSWSALGSGTSGTVLALAADGSGNLYAGGAFTAAGGTAANYLAKWNGTAWSAIGAGRDSTVLTLTMDATGNLYAGSLFRSLVSRRDTITKPPVTRRAAASRVAKWNGSTWTTLGAGINGAVQALAVDASGSVYAGGSFSYIGGKFTATPDSVFATCAAKWNGTAWSALDAGTGGTVQALTVDASGSVCAGGTFSSAGGMAANSVAKWSGTAWSALGTGFNNNINIVVVDASGTVYVGGAFTAAGGTAASYVAKWNGTAWSPLGTGLNGPALALVLDANGNLYAGGGFTTAGLVAAGFVAKWDGTAWSSLRTGLNNTVQALALDGGGNLYAGGSFSFTKDSTVAVSRVAKWDGTVWSALGAGLGTITTGQAFTANALAVDASGNLYVGGTFTTAGGAPANRVARWDGTAWSTLGTGLNSNVLALKMDVSGNLYAAGSFTTAGGASANRVAKWNGTAWTTLGTGLNGTVNCLLLNTNGSIYAGGTFTTAGGTPANRVAKWNGTAWSTLGTGLNNIVQTLAIGTSGKLYAGGAFITVGDGSKVTAYFGVYTPPLVPAPLITGFTPASGPVGTLVILAGTDFSGATAVTFNGIAAPGFVVNSATQITVSVPAGATSGRLAVTTPAGTGTSTNSFVVQNCVAATGLAVTSLTSGSAGLSFIAAATATGGYTATVTPASGTPLTFTGSTSPLALGGLAASTAYTVSLASACAAGQTATTSAISFTTPAAAVCQPPVLAVPAAQTAVAAPNQCSASRTFSASATGTPAIAFSYTAGATPITAWPYAFPVGTTIVTVRATNACGFSEKTFPVTVTDTQAPAIATNGNQNAVAEPGKCGAAVAASASATDNCTVGAPSGVRSDGLPVAADYPVGTTVITWTVNDASGNAALAMPQIVTVTDTQRPTIVAPAAVSLPNDAFGCARALATTALGTPISADNCTVVSVTNNAPISFPVGTTLVTWTVTDNSGLTATATQNVTITNAVPAIGAVAGTSGPLSLAAASVSLTAGFIDNNLRTATWAWSDGTTSAGTINSATSTVSGSRTYTAPGVYKALLSVQDACGSPAAQSYEYVVVYDPNGSFATGQGTMASPFNSALPYMQAAGTASFGFVAKYRKNASGVVDSYSKFQFKAGSIDFQSTAVTAMSLQINGDRAIYRGEGVVNGAGSYGFFVAATDGAYNFGSGPDKLRVKIWNLANSAVIYDNQAGDAESAPVYAAIKTGAILVQPSNGPAKRDALAVAASAGAAGKFATYPNPFHERVTVTFAFPQDETYTLEAYDLSGRLVKSLPAGTARAGELQQATWLPGQLATGIYTMRLLTPHSVQHLRLVRE